MRGEPGWEVETDTYACTCERMDLEVNHCVRRRERKKGEGRIERWIMFSLMRHSQDVSGSCL